MYHRRHGTEHHGKQKPAGREKEFDDGGMDVNPVYYDEQPQQPEQLITVIIPKVVALDLEVETVKADSGNNFAIKLSKVNKRTQQAQPELQSGLWLRQFAGITVTSLSPSYPVAQMRALLIEGESQTADHSDEVTTLVFSEQQPSLGATVIAAADSAHRLDQMQSSLSLTSLVQSAV